jgi:hypothetical protein
LDEHETYGNIRDIVGNSINEIEDAYNEFNVLLKERPFFTGPDIISWLREIINKNKL